MISTPSIDEYANSGSIDTLGIFQFVVTFLQGKGAQWMDTKWTQTVLLTGANHH